MSASMWDVVLDAERERIAEAAAELTQRVGLDAVLAHMASVQIQPPAPGVAVMACRCGRMLGTGDMRWAPPAPSDVCRPIPAIVCGVCRNRAW